MIHTAWSASTKDSRARIYRVKGLRVVDATAFAILQPGHSMSTICELCLSSLRVAEGFVLWWRKDRGRHAIFLKVYVMRWDCKRRGKPSNGYAIRGIGQTWN